MRFLVDESLSAAVADHLADAGHDAVHVAVLGLLGAPDSDVLASARVEGRVLLSADTDFGELLVVGRQPGTSVVIFRRAPRRPDAQAALLLAALPVVEDDLAAGAIVVLSHGMARIRRTGRDAEPGS